MDITINKIPREELKVKPEVGAPLGFGKIFTDYMFTMNYEEGRGWFDPSIHRHEDISLAPSAVVLHYSQEIFEGMKGYLRVDGKIGLFRPERNFRRFNQSAERMCMPTIPVEDQKQALFELLKLEKEWFPTDEHASLYIRPTMIGTDAGLGVKESQSYLYFIILSPSGVYFGRGLLPVTVYVSDNYIRAAIGGTGTAKTGGNYAATLLAGKEAKQKGCDQVLWLDAKERRYVEEIGAMNICFVFGEKIVTSELDGAILEGVTRDSVITLARDLGYKVEERNVSIDEVINGIETGGLTECFGCGTATIITPVGKLMYKNQMFEISDEPGTISKRLFEELTDIQWGRTIDRFGWTTVVE